MDAHPLLKLQSEDDFIDADTALGLKDSIWSTSNFYDQNGSGQSSGMSTNFSQSHTRTYAARVDNPPTADPTSADARSLLQPAEMKSSSNPKRKMKCTYGPCQRYGHDESQCWSKYPHLSRLKCTYKPCQRQGHDEDSCWYKIPHLATTFESLLKINKSKGVIYKHRAEHAKIRAETFTYHLETVERARLKVERLEIREVAFASPFKSSSPPTKSRVALRMAFEIDCEDELPSLETNSKALEATAANVFYDLRKTIFGVKGVAKHFEKIYRTVKGALAESSNEGKGRAVLVAFQGTSGSRANVVFADELWLRLGRDGYGTHIYHRGLARYLNRWYWNVDNTREVKRAAANLDRLNWKKAKREKSKGEKARTETVKSGKVKPSKAKTKKPKAKAEEPKAKVEEPKAKAERACWEKANWENAKQIAIDWGTVEPKDADPKDTKPASGLEEVDSDWESFTEKARWVKLTTRAKSKSSRDDQNS
ncbi:uncharacterized protein BDZ99DRAFT_500554 [Mytilinidion resinicola]|uniref:Uncharacterized protein n=1 Tax=Mytilinidion resinicola TaxID=574789 RepID=A0A6A6YFF8_9PEZI|nr:uncharacterized protein BDZ99DRAFT_500554 [Mytilinidion resinicola]KAF2807329.1 hypothetical protein BDZ99DRAFT_500554 [Mytilinidion resinicola]